MSARIDHENRKIEGLAPFLHDLPRWRVNGPLSNMPEFAAAFGCKQGAKMIREKVCEIW